MISIIFNQFRIFKTSEPYLNTILYYCFIYFLFLLFYYYSGMNFWRKETRSGWMEGVRRSMISKDLIEKDVEDKDL